MTTTAENLPDDVVERAAKAMYPKAMSGDDPEFWKMVSRRLLAALLDAGIVTLVPDVIRREPCAECGGRRRVGQVGSTTDPIRVCGDCGGSGKRPADAPIDRYQRASEQVRIASETSQHDHDTAACSGCREVYDAGHRFGADPPYRDMTPPAGGLPGDGWVRYLIADDDNGRRLLVEGTNGKWQGLGTSVDGHALHPDSAPEPAPRPTDGWHVEVAYEPAWGCWIWSLGTSGKATDLREQGVEPTREAAEHAAHDARTAWDARLGGAS